MHVLPLDAILYARRNLPAVWERIQKALMAEKLAISVHDGSEYLWKAGGDGAPRPGHKYLRRIPTGDLKNPWRYIYDEEAPRQISMLFEDEGKKPAAEVLPLGKDEREQTRKEPVEREATGRPALVLVPPGSVAEKRPTVAPATTPAARSKRGAKAKEAAEIPSLFDFLFAPEMEVPAPAEPVAVEPAVRAPTVRLPRVAQFGASGGMAKSARRKANKRALELADEALTGRELTPEERAEIALFSGSGGIGSSLNQYFTRPDTASAVWEHLIKLNGGKTPATVLEPAIGAGVFAETAPDGAKLTGVEIDHGVANIAQVLHGTKHEIVATSFEDFAVRNEGARAFDAAIGNAPFIVRTGGTSRIHKPQMTNADQYFIDTSLDCVKPGGIVAMIVHHGVTDSASARSFRERLMARGEILDIVRLPQESFEHAHTSVTSDVIFVRRRDPSVSTAFLAGGEDLMRAAGVFDDTFHRGQWFDVHEDRIFGAMGPSWRDRAKGDLDAESECSGDASVAANKLSELTSGSASPAAKPIALADLQKLANDTPAFGGAVEAGKMQASSPPQPGAMKVESGVTYILTGNPPRWHKVSEIKDVEGALGLTPQPALTEATEIASRIADLIAANERSDVYSARLIRREVEPRVRAWVDEYGRPDSHEQLIELAKVKRELIPMIGAVQADGSLSDIIRRDSAAVTQSSQINRESLDDVAKFAASTNGGVIELADVTTQWSKAKGRTPDEIRAALLGLEHLVLDGAGNIRPMVDATTGDLWAERDAARKAIADGQTANGTKVADGSVELAALERLVAALDASIMERWHSIDDIELDPRHGWIPHDVTAAFLETLDAARGKKSKITVSLENNWYSAEVTFDGYKTVIDDGLAPENKWQKEDYERTSGRRSSFMQHLNRLPIRGKAKEEVEETLSQFAQWLRDSPYRADLEAQYNRTFHGVVAKEYSTAPLEVQGVDPELRVNPHIYSTVRWAADQGKGVIALDVGLGKTFAGTILMRYLRNIGKAKRPFLVVPKSVATNWQHEIEKITPGARVLVIGETSTTQTVYEVTDADGKVTQYKKPRAGAVERTVTSTKSDDEDTRLHKLALMQQNSYDMVICTRPAFERIPMKPETEAKLEDADFFASRDAAMDARLDELGRGGGKRQEEKKAKAAEKARARFEAAEAARKFQATKAAVYWEDLGIDCLMADEAHSYKNLYSARQRFGQQVKFLGGSGLSKQSRDMQFKSEVVRQANHGNGVFLLTATPTKNSPLEIYNMLAHVAPEEFQRLGITNPETFIDKFCQIEERQVLDTDGNIVTAAAVTGFKNLTELHGVMDRYMLVRTAKDVGLKIPEASMHTELVDMTDRQHRAYTEKRAEAAEAAAANDDPGAVLRLLDQLKKAATDLELLDPIRYAGEAKRSPKYIAAVKRITEGVKERGGQIVFIDSVPSHAKLKEMLVEAGMKPEEVGIINGEVAKDSETRFEIGEAFNRGEIKVVIGNTPTMGEGVNLQKRATDIHHLDQPWDPGSMQQRNGRGVRQGNKAEAVNVWTYLCKRSLDGFRNRTLAGKRSWLDKLRSGLDTIENDAASDVGGQEELMVMLSDNPDEAREVMAGKKAEAMEAWTAKKRAESAVQFGRLMSMRARYGRIDPVSEAGVSQKMKIGALERRLLADKNLPDNAKEAIRQPVGQLALLAPETGTLFVEGQVIRHSLANKYSAAATIHQLDAGNQKVKLSVSGRVQPEWIPVAELNHYEPTGETDAGLLRAELDAAKVNDSGLARRVSSVGDKLLSFRPSLVDAYQDDIAAALSGVITEFKNQTSYAPVIKGNGEVAVLSRAGGLVDQLSHGGARVLLPIPANDALNLKLISAVGRDTWFSATSAIVGYEQAEIARGRLKRLESQEREATEAAEAERQTKQAAAADAAKAAGAAPRQSNNASVEEVLSEVPEYQRRAYRDDTASDLRAKAKSIRDAADRARADRPAPMRYINEVQQAIADKNEAWFTQGVKDNLDRAAFMERLADAKDAQ